MFKNQIERQIQEKLEPMNDRLDHLENHLVLLKKQLKAIEEQIDGLRLQMKDLSNRDRRNEDMINGVAVETENNDLADIHTQKVYYLQAPSIEGSFSEWTLNEQIGKSIYQLSTNDGINGTFIVLDTPDAIATAMISVSQFIKPACKIIGNTAKLPRRIETQEEGTAIYENGTWRVVNKAVVSLE